MIWAFVSSISAIGRGSISSFLKVAVDIAWVLACAALGFIWIVTAVAVFSMITGGHMAMFEHIDISQPGGIVRHEVDLGSEALQMTTEKLDNRVFLLETARDTDQILQETLPAR